MSDIKPILASQYHASMQMLKQAIDRCPDDLWLQTGPQPAPYWQIVYHTLFFADLYLQISDNHFKAWAYHVHEYPGLDLLSQNDGKLPEGLEPYSITQMHEYWQIVDDMVKPCLQQMDITSPESGFDWYKVSKLEHQLVNIRHIQHHTAQLADRLRVAANVGVEWVGTDK
ncbi:MAG: hypothetical protein ACF8OB_16080 [Phycisphaeraceae bacterium JB051]